MKVRIITKRLSAFKFGDIVEEDSPRIRCLLENGEAELISDKPTVKPEVKFGEPAPVAPVKPAPVAPVKKGKK